MSDTRNALPALAEAALTSDERWARWQMKGVRQDLRIARNMRLMVSATLTLLVIWAWVLLF